MLSFGYWTTNFAEVQRALSAKDLSAAAAHAADRRVPEDLHSGPDDHPGPDRARADPEARRTRQVPTYNDAIPLLMDKLCPNGVLGIALTGLLAAFMAGMAANVSSFNTVFTYDIWQTYVGKDRPDAYYLRIGRIVTVVGILIGIGTAFIAAGYSNIMNYIQLLFSFFNAPLFATFIIAHVLEAHHAVGRASGVWSPARGRGGHALRVLHIGLLLAGGDGRTARSTPRWPTSTARSPPSSSTRW